MTEDLKQQAESLGITVDKRWGEEKLKEKIAIAQAEQYSAAQEEQGGEGEQPEQEEQGGEGEQPEPEGLKNMTKGPQRLGSRVVQAGEVAKLTDADRKDKRTMRKVQHGMRIGTWKKV